VAVLMSRLRSVLGRDRIEHRDRGYLLHCDWLDATELAGLTAEIESRRQAGQVMGAVAAARVALSLPRGDGPQPLPGEWAQLRQVELDRLISRARLVAATALLEAGDWMGAADAAAAAAAQRDRYDEAALRILLRAHVMGGQMAGALALYASARQRMADELGTDPLARDGRALHRDPARRAGGAGPALPGRRERRGRPSSTMRIWPAPRWPTGCVSSGASRPPWWCSPRSGPGKVSRCRPRPSSISAGWTGTRRRSWSD
jgi:hypothetical protein